MSCGQELHRQAYFDGELDAIASAEYERHLEACEACQAGLAELDGSRKLVREAFAFGAPESLRARVQAQTIGTPRAAPAVSVVRSAPRSWLTLRPFWAGAFGGVATAGAAAVLAFALLAPPAGDVLVDGLLSGHVGSLLPGHLIAVESSDRHTVKPWFAGHADVSPAVVDLDAQGYKLIGGRADYLSRQRAAVLVYRHGAHVINVYCWQAESGRTPADTSRAGYRMVFWQRDDLRYAAVSDAGWDELARLRELLQAADGSAR